jgi:hypothetical protein
LSPLKTTVTVTIIVRITDENTPVIQPSLAPFPTDTGTPVRLRNIQTAMNPAPIAQMIQRTLNRGMESSRIDNAAAAKAMRKAAGLANETRASGTGGGSTGGVRMMRGTSTESSGSPDVGLPHM